MTFANLEEGMSRTNILVVSKRVYDWLVILPLIT